MSDGAIGSASLAGNPAGDGAAAGILGSAAPAAAPASTPPAAPAAAPAPAPAPASNWIDSVQDADLRGYLHNKGWKDPSELAVGYRNLEKLVGQDKLVLPKDDTDAQGWERVYDSLGRPKAASEYKLPVPEGMPRDFADAASTKFHELGLSSRQATQLAEWFNGHQAQMQEKMSTSLSAQREQDRVALKSEWGPAFDENIELGRRALSEFGLASDADRIEQALGPKRFAETMARIGRGLVEHNFEGGRTTQGFGMTTEAARARYNDLRKDPEFQNRYIKGDADARAEMTKLLQIAFPDEQR